MAQFSSTHKPKKLNLDKARKYLSEDESFYLLNHDVMNHGAINKSTPLPANFLACDLQFPSGENYAPNSYYSALTNETYSWHYNSNGVNFISRIKGDTGECQIVYSGNCLPLNPDPKHSIEQWRAFVKIDKLCANRHGIALVWVDGTDTPIGMIDVEASINTNFFTTPFFERCQDECAPLQMCVPEPQECLKGYFIPFTQSDKGKSNKMIDKGFKFMYRHIYYDQRASEWSDRSSLYYQDVKGCFDNSEGYARCMKLRIPVGNPLVDKIEFGFSEDGGITWFLAETIDKYKKYNSTQQYWYERDLAENISSTFSDIDCSFDYIFCNDKQRLPIDPLQISREFNPIPREVQGLLPYKNSLAFYNYKKGSCPIDKTEIDKFSIKMDCTISSTDCNPQFATVTARAIIYTNKKVQFVGDGLNGYIFREKGTVGTNIDDLTDSAWFGVGQKGFDQTFKDSVRNFIPYIEGTSYWGEMKQWKSTPNFGSVQLVNVLSGISSTTQNDVENDIVGNGNFYFQEYKFTVRKGEKGYVRLTSHHQTNGIGNNQNTSTQVIGMLGANGLKNYHGYDALNPDKTIKEMYFDTCNGDFDNFDAFIVNDLLEGDNGGYSGYITDKNNLPVEGLLVYGNGNNETTTDFNGFYCFNHLSRAIPIDLYAEQSCATGFTLMSSFNSQAAKKGMAVINYKIPLDTYKDDWYAKVDLLITDCANKPVSGLRIGMSGAKYKITDSNGIAHFKLRNYSTRDRRITAVIIDKGSCFTLDCNNNCNPCLPSLPSTMLPACFEHKPPVLLVMSDKINVSNTTSGKKGLKHGGRYAFGWVLEGDCSKLSAVNPIGSNGGYFDIPSIQQNNSLSFCNFSFLGGNINLPLWGKKLKIVRSANLNSYNLQWVVDKVENTFDGRLKLTIQSLNDYNTQYNFKTNTIYKYLQGDRIEFIRNGDGKLFDTATYGVLNYLTLSPFNDTVLSGVTNDANYFNQLLIANDGKLDGLKEGAIIEIQTPSSSTTEIAYFEICASIPVVNGQLSVQSGTFSTFDTFLVNRQVSKFPAQFFESKTPSDFWGIIRPDGSGLDDTGKVHFINKYENERRWGRNITINSVTQFNYFGDFEKTFGAKEQGDVIALSLKDDKVGLGISENDNFLFEVSDQLLRVGSNNIIQATTADSFISNPEAKLRGKYGCSYEDIGSIFFGDGFATYIDSQNNAYIIHDYRIAKPAGENLINGVIESSCNSFFKKRNIQKSSFNKTATNSLDKFRFVTGQNKHTGVVYLTMKSLRHSGINNASSVYELPNDTIMYNPANDSFLGFASFTPESYSQLDLHNETGCSFITYQNSLPFIHEVEHSKYNEFFGVACDWIVGITLNKGQGKLKIPIAMEIQSDKMFFAKKVTTDKPTFLSEIPPIRFKGLNGKWNAALLNDVNSKGGLYNGANARGYFTDVLLIRDNTISLQYNTIDDSKRILYSELDNILIKFEIVEQSGFTENL